MRNHYPSRGIYGIFGGLFGGLLLAVSYAGGTESADFAVRISGGGSYCTGETAAATVLVDMNLTGSNDREIRGFALAVCHVPYQLEITEAGPGAGLDPARGGTKVDFHQITVTPRGVIQAVIVDLREGRGLAPVNDLPVLDLTYDVVDAADGAPVWACTRTLNSPAVVISFSTGDQNYPPPEENLGEVEIRSACDPEKRTFHLRTEVADPLKVRCGTQAGKTIVDVLLKEDPIACCAPRLLKGIVLDVKLPEDLEAGRFLPGDFQVVKIRTTEIRTPGEEVCIHAEILYSPSVRFGEEFVAVRFEVASRSGMWPDGFAPVDRVIELRSECGSLRSGVVFVDGREVPFAEEAAAVLHVVPHCPEFRRGDSNADGDVDIADAINLLTWLYASEGREPPCMDAADANDDGIVDIGDPITILSRLYGNGPPFPEPADACGRDPTEDDLDCPSFPPCGVKG